MTLIKWILAGALVSAFTLVSACGSDADTDASATVSSRETAKTPSVSRVIRGEGALPAPIVRSIDELFTTDAVYLVVEGRVTSTSVQIDGVAFPMTRMTVEVERHRGQLASRTITVLEAGGQVPVRSLTAEQARILELPQSDESEVVDFAAGFGAEHPKAGDQVVLFLRRPSADGVYLQMMDSLGRFSATSDGRYLRAGNETGFDPSLERADLDTQLKDDLPK